MNNLIAFLRYIILISIQILIFDNMHLWGFVSPYIYVLFVFWLPIEKNSPYFLIYAFFTGLFLDGFNDGGGVHTISLVLITYLRKFIIHFVFGNYYQTTNERIRSHKTTYLIILIFCHHLIMFFFEIFEFSGFLSIINLTFWSGLFTTILCIILRPLLEKITY